MKINREKAVAMLSMRPYVHTTFPGRYGDILWALPAIRALSWRVGYPIALVIAGEFASIAPLLRQQAYLSSVYVLEDWVMTAPELWHAPLPTTEDWGIVFHLGYRGWPQRGLPFETLDSLNDCIGKAKGPSIGGFLDGELALHDPWITVDGPGVPCELAVGFTEAWFELKYGLMTIIERHLPPYRILTPPGTRWATERVPGRLAVLETDWIGSARAIRNADRFLGDCSALHVLATAIGTPVICMEPMEARWNPIFWPLGMDGLQITIVRGGDGRPTFDARAVRDALTLARTPVARTQRGQEQRQ